MINLEKQALNSQESKIVAREKVKTPKLTPLEMLAIKMSKGVNVNREQAGKVELPTIVENSTISGVATHKVKQMPRDSEELFVFYNAQYDQDVKLPSIKDTHFRTGLSIAQLKKYHRQLKAKGKLVFKDNYVMIGGIEQNENTTD